ncbi:MFS general substrate transporter [Corynespora cassiicola Philippines]|uniref:MFS general substrate transporter n=1 Tax=Corynespora cassiicola Philippines TaxID=1448308 RepID=A0A2T2NJJ4_CORCC|nr:MFS general substrate transporter [Corynespora cassiicola Philippines]
MSQDESKSAPEEAAAAPAVTSSVSPVRLQFIIAGIWLCLFMASMDTTIITTALIKISSEYNALSQAPWLVTAYLLPYNSFLMITARLSDVWGLKAVLLASNLIFLVFSMACGASHIVFRAFQGIGGSGLYSLAFVSIMKLVDPEKMGFYSGVISSVFAVSNLLGPLLGGTITDRTDWRWIFWINGPIVGTSLILLFFSMPKLKDEKSQWEKLRGFDSIGGLLSVGWPIPLLFALQEAGTRYPWSSGVIIGTLIAGIIGFFLFGGYEAWVSFKTKKEPVLPMRFLTKPCMALLLASFFLYGFPMMVVFIQLPQRFQYVNFTSAERAGILLLPVTLMTPVGAMLSGGVLGKRMPIELILLAATGITCIGFGLMSSLPVDSTFFNGTYGYEIITGLGLGLASAPYYMLLHTSVKEKDISIGTGTLNMMRILGGAVAVAICSALHQSELQKHLPAFLNLEQMEMINESFAFTAQLPEETRKELGRVFGKSYNKQFQVMLAFTGLNFLVVILLSLVRKKKGVFGVLPVRKEENEFMKAAETKEGSTENDKGMMQAREKSVADEPNNDRGDERPDEISKA